VLVPSAEISRWKLKCFCDQFSLFDSYIDGHIVPVVDSAELVASSDVSFRPTSVFTGREDILAQLDNYFNVEGPAKQEQHIFVLYGLGGAGKTQIALKFVNQFYNWYDCSHII
jgi:hypothetical protein